MFDQHTWDLKSLKPHITKSTIVATPTVRAPGFARKKKRIPLRSDYHSGESMRNGCAPRRFHHASCTADFRVCLYVRDARHGTCTDISRISRSSSVPTCCAHVSGEPRGNSRWRASHVLFGGDLCTVSFRAGLTLNTFSIRSLKYWTHKDRAINTTQTALRNVYDTIQQSSFRVAVKSFS